MAAWSVSLRIPRTSANGGTQVGVSRMGASYMYGAAVSTVSWNSATWKTAWRTRYYRYHGTRDQAKILSLSCTIPAPGVRYNASADFGDKAIKSVQAPEVYSISELVY